MIVYLLNGLTTAWAWNRRFSEIFLQPLVRVSLSIRQSARHGLHLNRRVTKPVLRLGQSGRWGNNPWQKCLQLHLSKRIQTLQNIFLIHSPNDNFMLSLSFQAALNSKSLGHIHRSLCHKTLSLSFQIRWPGKCAHLKLHRQSTCIPS